MPNVLTLVDKETVLVVHHWEYWDPENIAATRYWYVCPFETELSWWLTESAAKVCKSENPPLSVFFWIS